MFRGEVHLDGEAPCRLHLRRSERATELKQLAQNYKTGELRLLEVPVPTCKPGGIVVRTEYSLVSAGTELMKVSESKLSLAGKARARPDQVKRVLESAAQQGLVSTYRKVMNRLDSYTPLGYSASGVVVESMVDDLPVGTRLATAGNEFAFHAEFNFVPHNLCVPVPDGVSSEHAAFATVGSIALHAFRRSGSVVGETVAVIGLGLIGQLLVQIANAAGVKVVGIDPTKDRCELAMKLGAYVAGSSDAAGLDLVRDHLLDMTDGFGADTVFLAAGTKSKEPVSVAAMLARDKARIVDIGRLPLDLPWSDYYEKELDVIFSRSYGPGRYDSQYEIDGVDYPIGYVRWTERRNMQAFLDLVESGRVDVGPLMSRVVPFAEAVSILEAMHAGQAPGIGTLFEYPTEAPLVREVHHPEGPARSRRKIEDVIRVGLIGCGNYASSMLVPHLVDRHDVELSAVATSSALSGATAQERFGFSRTTTDYETILEADDIDAVLIATRHDLHARIVETALEASKAVFVEKPLCITNEELLDIRECVLRTGNDRLFVGFNRRFAPLLNWMRDSWGSTRGPTHITYSVNAGPVADDSWYRDTDKYGSRFVGEGGHFIDTLSWWLGEEPTEAVSLASPPDGDEIELLLSYPSGSVGHISYLTRGAAKYPKETMRISGDGRTATFDNFKRASLWVGGSRPKVRKHKGGIDKGQEGEISAFLHAVLKNESMPIGIHSLLRTTEATLAAERSHLTGMSVALGELS